MQVLKEKAVEEYQRVKALQPRSDEYNYLVLHPFAFTVHPPSPGPRLRSLCLALPQPVVVVARWT